jgi:hypothetical protein
VAILILIAAAYVLVYQFGVSTGLVIYLLALMFGLCITIMILPLNNRFAFALTALSIVAIIFENTI